MVAHRNRPIDLRHICPATAVAPVFDLASALLGIAADVLDQTVERVQARDALEPSDNGARIIRQAVDRDPVGVYRVVD